MNESGVLGKFIPDFGKIVGLMQFNMYHHYTADEHLIKAVGELNKIFHNQNEDFDILNSLSLEMTMKKKSFHLLFSFMILLREEKMIIQKKAKK